MITVDVFKGATFQLEAAYVDDDGAARSLTGVTIDAALRSADGALPVTVTVIDAATGRYSLAADTTTWPKGLWPLFVSYAAASKVDIEQPCSVRVKVMP
jgi:hypothetical protein